MDCRLCAVSSNEMHFTLWVRSRTCQKISDGEDLWGRFSAAKCQVVKINVVYRSMLFQENVALKKMKKKHFDQLKIHSFIVS